MKKTFSASLHILLIFFILPINSYAENYDVFVLAGQSNMHGYQGDASRYPLDINQLDKLIPFYWVTPGESDSHREWQTLKPQPGRFPSGHFGPEITFARKLYSAGYHPAIFKYSLPGSSLANDWKAPGAGGLYDKMELELKQALKVLENAGNTYSIKAFVWVQGESDANSKEIAEAYAARLQTLISNVRKQIAKNEKLPIILGVDEQHPWVLSHPEIVSIQKNFADKDDNIVFTSMLGLEKADSTHLTSESLDLHGNRLFDGFIKIINKKALPSP